MEVLDSTTLVPLGVAISAVLTLLGGATWLTRMYTTTQSNSTRLDKIEEEMHETQKIHSHMETRLTAIETELKVLPRILDGLEKLRELIGGMGHKND